MINKGEWLLSEAAGVNNRENAKIEADAASTRE
jgi:hypothetical protein